MVGAARVPGIRSMWPRADTPEFQREVQEYLTVPYTARGSAAVTVPVIATGGSVQHDSCSDASVPICLHFALFCKSLKRPVLRLSGNAW